MEILNNPNELITELSGNQKWMEEICIATHVTLNDALDKLLDYALYVGEQDRYPIKRQQSFYGFHRYLLRGRNFDKKKPDNNQRGLVI